MNNASKKRPALQQLAARSTDKITKRDPCVWPKVTRGRHAPESTDFKPSIRITATVLNIDRNESFYEISYTDLDGHDRIKLIGRELFRTPAKVVDILVKAHASLSHDSATAIDLVRKALDAKSDRRFCVTGRSGWHDGSIVYPTETFGELADELLHEGASDIDPALGLWKGKLARWRKGLREPCELSDYLVFSIAVAGAGILLDIIAKMKARFFTFTAQNRKNHLQLEKRRKARLARRWQRARRLRRMADVGKATLPHLQSLNAQLKTFVLRTITLWSSSMRKAAPAQLARASKRRICRT